MIYDKKNYIIMIVSLVIIVIGFALMSGGGSKLSMDFHPEVFSFRRIVLAPVVCVIGFALMIYGILKKTSKKNK